MEFAYTKKIDSTFDITLDDLRFELADKGFWIVSNIDISEKIVTKVTSDFWPYRLLWVCNPELAYKYLRKNLEYGIFLPCSIAVYEKEGSVYVSVWLPEVIISSIVIDENLKKLWEEIWKTLISVVDSI